MKFELGETEIITIRNLICVLRCTLKTLTNAAKEKKNDWHGYDWDDHQKSIKMVREAISKTVGKK
jgi:hypothetical protein